MVIKARNFSVRVVQDIYDPDLVAAWQSLQSDADIFPQMYYEWCEPWWRLQSDDRELHIVVVEDKDSRTVAIAPLCIEKRVGLRVMVSFPIHFGDFYFFLIEKSPDDPGIYSVLIEYLRSFRDWQTVHLVNVNDESPLYGYLVRDSFCVKRLTDVLVAKFRGMSFSEYMTTLSRNARQKYGKYRRRLEKKGVVQLESIESSAGYMKHVEEMKNLYSSRWVDDHSLPPDDRYYRCRNEAVCALFNQEKMALFLLTLDGKTIAFRLGFLHNQTFFDWKVSHDPNFGAYSPGNLLIGMIVDHLISSEYMGLNFMTGEYGYKRSWATDELTSTNFEVFAANRSIRANLYVQYRLKWRERIRRGYYNLLDIAWIRSVKRWLQSQMRRIGSRV